MKKIAELRNFTTEELNIELLRLRKMQFNLRMKRANGLLEKPHQFRRIRIGIAQVKTVLSEKVKS